MNKGRAKGETIVGDFWIRTADKSRGLPEQLREVVEVSPSGAARMADVVACDFTADGSLLCTTHGKAGWISPTTFGQPSKYRKVEAPRAPVVEPIPMRSESAIVDVACLRMEIDSLRYDIRALSKQLAAMVPKQLAFKVAG